MHVFDPKDIAIVQFGSKASVLKKFDDDYAPEALVEKIFALTPKGFTNIYQGLKLGIAELGERRQSVYTSILLSDCDLNTGKNPTSIVWQLRGLHIITIPPKSGVNDFIAKTLQKITRGTLNHAGEMKDIPIILSKVLQ